MKEIREKIERGEKTIIEKRIKEKILSDLPLKNIPKKK